MISAKVTSLFFVPSFWSIRPDAIQSIFLNQSILPTSPFFTFSSTDIAMCLFLLKRQISPLQSPGIRSQLELCGQLQGWFWRSYFNEKQVTNTLHTLTRFYRPIVCMLMSFLKVNADSSRLTVFLCECSSPARQASATSR